MTGVQLAVTILGGCAIGWVLWYFLGSRAAPAAARDADGVQEVRILVKGGYSPDTILVQAGKPERVVFEHFSIDQALPAFQNTTIEFTPGEPGEFPFRCGMSMLKGRLVVEPAVAERRAGPSPHPAHG